MDVLKLFCDKFNNLTKAPDKFLTNGLLTGEFKHLLKELYDFDQNYQRISDRALPELIVKEFDDEQIWQELELQNEGSLPNLINKASRLLVSKNLAFPVKTDQGIVKKNQDRRKKVKETKVAKQNDAISSEEETEEDIDNDDDELDDEENVGVSRPRVKIVPSEVDDQFFKLSEMEAFLKNQEENGDVGAGVDLFGEILSDSEDEDDRPMYNTFFGEDNAYDEEDVKEEFDDDEEDIKEEFDDGNEDYDEEDVKEEFDDVNEDELSEDGVHSDVLDDDGDGKQKLKKDKKKVKFNMQSNSESEDDSSEDDNKVKSSYEVREENLRKKIAELEDEAVQEKPWPLKGEVSATVRPINSLLEEVVEFDMTRRPPPIITEETSNRLEDIIKQRIRDQAYDDVERKVKPIATPNEFKKKLVLDQEKSKLSLAEVYEKEYLKQKEGNTPNPEGKTEVEPEEHKIIKNMMKSLFLKLDALTNFFFVPKPIVPDLKVVSNLPAVQMEEVAPVGVSDAKLLAPDEIGGSFKKSLLAKEERTKTDKKRERRKKKAQQAQKFKAKALKDATKPASYNEELKKVMKFKNVSKLNENSVKKINTSNDFFSKLQDEVQSPSLQKGLNKRKSNQTTKSAKKLKL